jgi:hypothetical protein
VLCESRCDDPSDGSGSDDDVSHPPSLA